MDQQDLDLEDKPLDPAVERVRRKLVRFMAINLGLLFLALMAVVLAIVYRWTRAPAPEEVAISQTAVIPGSEERLWSVPLPEGTRVTGFSHSGNRVALDTVAADGTRILVIFDYANGQIAGRIALPSL